MYSIKWTKQAYKSYKCLHIGNETFQISLDQVIEILKKLPKSFPFDETFEVHKVVIVKRCILFYHIIESKKEVHLLLFFDTKANPKHIKQLI